ncbi:MAG: tetratricopeptide repeat protein [Acidobacteriaceae bacterium]|nr:tetratricopeptide repeat protein [Acidobacteriaceae bacterium]
MRFFASLVAIAGCSLTTPFTASQSLPPAIYDQGRTALDRKNYAVAEQDFAQAEAAAPGTTNALALRAKALIHLDKFPEAEQCLKQYLHLHPESPDASYLLGYVQFRKNSAAESLQTYTAAARLQQPQASDLKIVGLDYVLLNDYQHAIRWLERSITEQPNDAEAVYYLGRAYYVQNSFDKAISCFERALQLDPKYLKAEDNLGLAHEGKNRLDLAEADYRKAIAIGTETAKPSEQPYLNLADLLSRSQRNSEALAKLDVADQISGKSERSEELRARIFFAEKRYPEAETALRAALLQKPENGALHFLLGRVLKQEGKATEAEREFARTRELLGTHSSVPN